MLNILQYIYKILHFYFHNFFFLFHRFLHCQSYHPNSPLQLQVCLCGSLNVEQLQFVLCWSLSAHHLQTAWTLPSLNVESSLAAQESHPSTVDKWVGRTTSRNHTHTLLLAATTTNNPKKNQTHDTIPKTQKKLGQTKLTSSNGHLMNLRPGFLFVHDVIIWAARGGRHSQYWGADDISHLCFHCRRSSFDLRVFPLRLRFHLRFLSFILGFFFLLFFKQLNWF